MRHRGFEPRTTWLKVKCSTDWANIPYLLSWNWASWIRTSECRSQSPVPYRLAIAQRWELLNQGEIHKGGYRDSNPGPPEPQSGALTNCAIPTIVPTPLANVLEGIRTPDPRLRRPLLYPAELWTHIFIISFEQAFKKRVMGIEPTYPAWKAGVLPLNYTRI